MSEDLTKIAREAKFIHQALKDLLKSKEPHDRDVEFQRKNLRKRYLSLLLLHPSAKESKDVETALWMHTSYAFISAYKQRISAIDRTIQANAIARQAEGSKQQQQQNQKQNGHGPVEYRKLVQRFRQFLAEEEKFWIQLVLRMHRAFDLTEANEALATLGFTSATAAADGITPTNVVFPQEDGSVMAPANSGERESLLSTMSKALICLGDIARYRELYNESGGRPKAGQETGAPARRGKVRRKGPLGIEAAPMARNYDRAQVRYEQARLLVPQEGNASHQLAIVATYLPDALLALMHYYRSLCVKHPYEPAAENMVIHISKTLQQWNRTKQERERILSSPPVSVQNQVDIFKNRLVVLHALWQKNMEREVKDQERRISSDFRRLVGERNLPADLICNIVVISQGGLWKHRMIRDVNTGQKRREVARTPEVNTLLEWRIYRHLLDIHIALLDVGKHELKDLPPFDSSGDDLAQRITATFRRTLPALRIASKWVRANLNYMMQDPEFKSQQQNAKARGSKVPHKTRGTLSGSSTHTIRFWNNYSQFVNALAQAFPNLSPLSHPLEEDIDMRGFLPLKKMMGDGVSVKDRTSGVHPNVEQLMRISDLLADAEALAAMEGSPLSCDGGVYQLKQSMVESPTRPSRIDNVASNAPEVVPPAPDLEETRMEEIRDCLPPDPPKEEDAMTEATSRTDDDIVNAAFRHVGLGPMEDDEDEDEIVWNPRAVSPVLSPLVQASPVMPIKSLGGPVGNVQSGTGVPYQLSLSPKQAAMKTPMGSPRAPLHALNAQDLLLNVMNIGRNPGAGIGSLDSPRPKAPALYGTDLSHQSIWSASRDEQLKFGAGSSHLGLQTSPRSFPHSLSAPQETVSTPSTWSSQTMQAPSMPFQSPGHVHHASYPSPLAPLQNGVTNQHHRVRSVSQTFASPLSLSQYGNLPFNDPAVQAVAPQAHQPQASLHQMLPQHSQPPLQQHHQPPSFSQYYEGVVDQAQGYPSHAHHDPRSTAQAYTNSLLWGKAG